MRFVKTVESIFDIPQGFTRVEYLESSGTQYIDTGYKANSTTKVEIKTQGQTWTFGGRTSIAVGDALGICFNANLVALQFGSQSINYNQTGIAQQVSECVISQDGAYINGVLRASFTSETFSCPNNLYLFEINNNGSLGDGLKGKMWYCRIYDNGTLIRDYIPCIDPLGVACMYDLVGKKPYYNVGTGNFTVGRQIIPVEYLEGTGTQYIDTGVRGFADFEIGVKLRESVPNVSIFCGNGHRLERYNASNPYWRFRNNNDFYNSGVSITEYHVMAWKNDEIYADGVKLQDFAKTWNVPANMTLFGVSASGSYPSMIYFCKLWNPTDGTLLRDFIPCKDENDNGFLFDKLSGGCYLNNGTGNFAFGENKYKTKLRLVKDNKLPAGYTQVEYLESSGTQYIDTGVVGKSGLTAKLKFKYNSGTVGKDKYILACAQTSPVIRFYFGTYQSKWQYGYGSALQANGIQDETLYDCEVSWIKSNQYVKVNGITIITGTSGNEYDTQLNMYLFTRNQPGSTVGFIVGATLYYCQLFENGIMVRDFIPALDPTGTPCMYDLVTKAPFYNQGTGTFSYGKTISMVRFVQDIIPREYAAVNYIESTGTQYIDTGIPNKEDLTYQVTAAITRYASDYPLCGVVGVTQYSCQRVLMYNNSIGIQRGIYGALTLSISYDDNFHTYYSSPTKLKIDGMELSYSRAFSGDLGSNTFFLLAYTNVNGTIKYSQPAKLCCSKLWDNGTLVRNFVPVIRRIDKVAGMWDTVTKQFFSNSGTGAFNFG